MGAQCSTGRSPDAIILASPLQWADQCSVQRWLLASLVLHLVLAWWWQGRLTMHVYQAPDIAPTLGVTLRKAQPGRQATQPAPAPSPAPSPATAPSAVPSTPEVLSPETADAPSVSQPSVSRSPLDLSLPKFVAPEAPVATDNGATVMDSALSQRLQKAPRRTGYAARSDRGASGDFQAGGWVEFVRDGDRCFRVARADPLASYDYDVWYRVRCPEASALN